MLKNWVHIGLPKTGTTTLQRHFFPEFDGTYICTHTDQSDVGKADISQLKYTIIDSHDLEHDKHLHKARSFLENLDKPVLFSEEAIAAGIYNDQRVIAERIKALFGENTNILVFIREQRDMLRSMYAQLSLGFSQKMHAVTFEEWSSPGLMDTV